MPLPDVWDLFDHWKQYPPQHILMRGYVGYESKDGGSSGAEEKVLGLGAKPFDQLPDYVRQAIELDTSSRCE